MTEKFIQGNVYAERKEHIKTVNNLILETSHFISFLNTIILSVKHSHDRDEIEREISLLKNKREGYAKQKDEIERHQL